MPLAQRAEQSGPQDDSIEGSPSEANPREANPVDATSRVWTVLTVLLLLAATTLLLWRLSATDLWAPDEPRYAQVAEEMRALERGAADLVLLRLNGEPYTQKPPLYYWLAALSGAPGGRVTEWAARLPSALAGIAAIWVTLQLGQSLFRSRAIGLWSGAILLTAFRFAHLARRAQLDVLLALFEAAALLAFWRLDRSWTGEQPSHRRRGTLVLLHAALGCAVLAKGPVGLLPLAVMAGYLAWEGRLASMRRLLPAWGWLLSVAPALLWFGSSAALAPDGFLHDAVVENLFARFFAGSSHPRPFYYYAYQFPLDFMPWATLWPLAGICALRTLRGRAQGRSGAAGANATSSAWRFTLTWLGVFVVFFSLSAGKRGLYLLPAFPAAAIACGAALATVLARRDDVSRSLVTLAIVTTGALLAAGAYLALVPAAGLELESLPGFPIPRSFGFALIATGTACVAALSWRIAVGTLGRERLGPRISHASIAACGLILTYGIELALFSLVYPAFDPQKSPRPIALALESASPPGSPVAVFRHRSMIGGLSYYGSRRVVALDSLDAVLPFLQAGGGAIATSTTHRRALQATAALGVRNSLRRGRREMLILAPDRAEQPSPTIGVAEPP